MIFQPTRFLFIHTPRTAGNSIKTALAPHLIGIRGAMISNCWWPVDARRHTRACDLVDRLPQWEKLYKFAVIRSPWETTASMFSHFREMDPDAILSRYDGQVHLVQGRLSQFIDEIRSAQAGPFDRWLMHHYDYLQIGGGHWGHWCETDDGQDLGVNSLIYENLAAEWPQVAALIGIPGVELPTTNAANREPVDWTPAAVDFVRQRFAGDFEKFGYAKDPPSA
jgi:hypothetical protein